MFSPLRHYASNFTQAKAISSRRYGGQSSYNIVSCGASWVATAISGGLTEDGLIWATKNLNLDLTADKKKQLMDAYLSLAAFPDVKPGLETLKKAGVKLAILSNGEPKMLEAAAKSAGIRDLLDEIISVEEVKIFKVSPRV